MLRRVLTLVAVPLLVLALSLPAFGEEPAGKPAGKEDVKAVTDVINGMAKACKAKDKEKVKTFLSKDSLEDVKKDPAFFDMFMEMCGDQKVDKETKMTIKGSKMTVVRTIKEKDGTMTETTRLVKEGGQWKLGK